MRDALQARGIRDVDLEPGSPGQFDITLDGRLVYSRQRSGRFPSTEDIAKLAGQA